MSTQTTAEVINEEQRERGGLGVKVQAPASPATNTENGITESLRAVMIMTTRDKKTKKQMSIKVKSTLIRRGESHEGVKKVV